MAVTKVFLETEPKHVFLHLLPLPALNGRGVVHKCWKYCFWPYRALAKRRSKTHPPINLHSFNSPDARIAVLRRSGITRNMEESMGKGFEQ